MSSKKRQHDDSTPDLEWINPLGGLGDTLMLSGVLKLVVEKDPSARYNLIRRARYPSILHGHPVISTIGFPPPHAKIIGSDYWSAEGFSKGEQRAFQILAQKFGLDTPAPEILYLPPDETIDTTLLDLIPWEEQNVLIAPTSDSPRKMMPADTCEEVVSALKENGIFVIQSGKAGEEYIRGAYSLLGLTSPRQVIALVKRVDAVISVDNFVMHAAHLTGTHAVVAWGPTSPEVYGYDGQTHLKGLTDHCTQKTRCLGPQYSHNYPTTCPLQADHCMKTINSEKIIASLISKKYIITD